MPKQKIALITGITGQDGAYLTHFLLNKGYTVHGLVRWDATEGTQNLVNLGVLDRCTLHWGDLIDPCALAHLLQTLKPDEIYNLGAISDVPVSFITPAATLETNTKGTLNLLEAMRLTGLASSARLYQASSSEMFGSAPPPQHENTPMEPCSPYGIGKLAAYWLVRTYRDAYDMHASNGILFNHESPLRGWTFVTHKITCAAGNRLPVTLGNLNAQRDWGHARDYVKGMWMMLQCAKPDDYVLATGQMRTVRECATCAYAYMGITLIWEGEGLDEIGRCTSTGRVFVRVDQSLFRPKEVPALQGDATKARTILGWNPSVDFDSLIAEMIETNRLCPAQAA